MIPEICFFLIIVFLHLNLLYFTKFNELIIWYFLHFIGNFYIVVCCIEPILIILNDPIKHLLEVDVNYYDSMIMITILHIYHILFFKCTKSDIFHHVFFVGLGFFTIYYYNNGYYSALSHFFICGLPGGIDYFLLFLYKLNKISKKTRLRIAMFLNIWIRSPGLCIVATFSILKYIYAEKKNLFELILQIIMSMGNGQFYMAQITYANGKYNRYKD